MQKFPVALLFKVAKKRAIVQEVMCVMEKFVLRNARGSFEVLIISNASYHADIVKTYDDPFYSKFGSNFQ